MMAVVAENETALAAAASDHNDDSARPPPPAPKRLLDPQLLMAARRGDSEELLLRLMNDGDQDRALEAAAASEVVIVDVVPRRRSPSPAAAPPPPPPPSSSSGPATSAPRQPLVDGVTSEGDTLLHVVAACGDGEDFLRCAKMIVHDYYGHKGGATAMRLALEARNNKGDTPLHCAAGAGNANMIGCLIDLIPSTADDDNAAGAAAKKKTFLRMQNQCGETALHQAVRAASKDAIDKLLSVDPELACSSSSKDAGAACSPFFLAVSLWGEDDEMDIARHLFDKTRPSIRSDLSYYCSGPNGRNVLHAAVSRASVKTVILLSQLLMSAAADECRLLLSQLASQRDKENGSTPLHLAASLDGLPSSCLFVPPKVRPPPPGTTPLWPLVGSDAASVSVHKMLPLMPSLVLNANVAMAYQPDKTGLYPIHVAAGSGNRDAVEMLLERCPDCATLRDAKGRTLLHVAAEEGHSLVVNYVCQQSQKQSRCARAGAAARLPGLLSSILNAQDINGDTALHRAVHAGQLVVVLLLIRTQQVRLDVPNKVGMRPIDVSWTTMPLKAYYAWDPRIIIRRSLLSVGAPYGENNRGDLFLRKKCILSKEDNKEDEEKKMSENLTDAAQVLALFSVLSTTVTFASAFTLPGGYRSAGDGGDGVAGTPVLAGPKRSYAFDAFVLSDTLAFLCSLLATSLLVYAGVPYGTLTNRFSLLNAAYALMWHAGRSLVAAFALGLYVVLLPVARTIAIAIGVLMIISVYVFLKGSEGIDAMLPMGTNQRTPFAWGNVLYLILHLLDRFWSYVIIFGLPAIRRWASLP